MWRGEYTIHWYRAEIGGRHSHIYDQIFGERYYYIYDQLKSEETIEISSILRAISRVLS